VTPFADINDGSTSICSTIASIIAMLDCNVLSCYLAFFAVGMVRRGEERVMRDEGSTGQHCQANSLNSMLPVAKTEVTLRKAKYLH
jgi:hypothetical protein